MSRLEELQPNAAVRGILPDAFAAVVGVQWFGSEALEITYKAPDGKVANELLGRKECVVIIHGAMGRQALGGQVFDVLGKLQFEGKPLRDLLIAAIRYGERPEVRARLTQVVANAFDPNQLQELLEERALAGRPK